MNCELKGSPWESIRLFFRLRVVPRLSSRIVERAKRKRVWKSPHARKGDTRRGLASGAFHARSRFARSTITEEKWGTTRLLPPPRRLTISPEKCLFLFSKTGVTRVDDRNQVVLVACTLRDRPLEKLWGGGGGNFRGAGIFFRYQISCMNFF